MECPWHKEHKEDEEIYTSFELTHGCDQCDEHVSRWGARATGRRICEALFRELSSDQEYWNGSFRSYLDDTEDSWEYPQRLREVASIYGRYGAKISLYAREDDYDPEKDTGTEGSPTELWRGFLGENVKHIARELARPGGGWPKPNQPLLFAACTMLDDSDEEAASTVVKHLIASDKVDVNLRDEYAWRWACRSGDLAVVGQLLSLEGSRRVDVSARDYQGFRWACRQQALEAYPYSEREKNYSVVHRLLLLDGDRRHSPWLLPQFYDDENRAACVLQAWFRRWFVPRHQRGQVRRVQAIIMLKPEWRTKLPRLCGKWEKELVSQRLSPRVVKRALAELLRGRCAPVGWLTPARQDGVRVATFEHLPVRTIFDAFARSLPSDERELFWHPGTNEKVLDLVHPSMCPYLHGTTPTLVPVTTPQERAKWARPAMAFLDGTATDVQWIPAEFYVSHHGHVQVLETIPGLPEPRTSVTHRAIGRAFATILPEFEALLEQDLHGRALQVIVKVAMTELKIGSSGYSRGSWHVEGTDAERIVCSAVCYYDVENISRSLLEFRKFVDHDDITYGQGEHQHVADTYDRLSEEPSHRPLGAVEAKAGRCVVFLNDIQHRVRGFSLRDHTKPGRRSILCFFLVDPNCSIPSAAIISDQYWWRYARVITQFLNRRNIHPDTIKIILDYAREGLDQAQARDIRSRLMAARQSVQVAQNEDWEEEISLCEH